MDSGGGRGEPDPARRRPHAIDGRGGGRVAGRRGDPSSTETV